MNRLTGITYPDGSAVSFIYDSRGRRISVTDQNNRTTTYTYDDADRLTAVTDPANHTTQYNYDTEDNLLSITDANNNTTQFAYNARGWVTQTTFPSTLQESYNYDLVGNLLSKTDRKNQTIQYVYDALYRLTSKTYPDQTAVDYAYDLAGKVQQVSDPTGTYSFAYDNMGRLIGTTTTYTWLPGLNFQNAYTYDAASNRTALTAPDGSVTTYGYDTLNRLNGLANTWAGSFGFSYDALSRRTQMTRPNGIATNYSYDSLSHLLSVLHQAGTTTLDGAGYAYDAAGNRTSKTNYLNGVTSNYGYDLLYELTQVTQGGSTTETYDYDAFGNLINATGSTPNNYLFAGEQYDPALGLYYNRARYLNVRTARFITLDHDDSDIGQPKSLHLYLYAAGDPVNHIDPSGNDTLTEVSIAQAVMLTLAVLTTLAVLSQIRGKIEIPFRANHYTQWAFVPSILVNGIDNPFGGKNYVTTDLYFSKSEAKAKLALRVKPQVMINLFVYKNGDDLLGPNPVEPYNGEPGGGTEYSTSYRIPVATRFPVVIPLFFD